MSAETADAPNLDVLLDVPLELSVELASCSIATADVLELKPGSVVEFEGTSNDPVALYVNRKLVARGEIVIGPAGLGIRVTEIVARGDE
jgi:flagellar motor switch protein FliN/FliY